MRTEKYGIQKGKFLIFCYFFSAALVKFCRRSYNSTKSPTCRLFQKGRLSMSVSSICSPISPASAAERRRQAFCCFGAAAALVPGVYLSQLLHLLEAPLFSRIYYGNLSAVFFSLLAAGWIFLVTGLVLRLLNRRLGLRLFAKHPPLPLRRKALLYAMTVIPIVTVGLLLDQRFKFVYVLGDRVTAMTFLGNAAGYLLLAARLFAAVGVMLFFDRGAAVLWPHLPLPLGGLAAMAAFCFWELYLTPGVFSAFYLFLYVYCGAAARISQGRFAVTYTMCLLLYCL